MEKRQSGKMKQGDGKRQIKIKAGKPIDNNTRNLG